MNHIPKISIIVPVYGVEKYIARCADSLFKQSYKNIEYIFVNDCTKDKSISILQEILKCFPDRMQQVKIINHERNRGLAATRNTGIAAATGDFVMHVDSDDWIEANAVELLVNKQIETNADYVMANAIQLFKTHHVLRIRKPILEPHELSLTLVQRKMIVAIWGMLIRTSLYRDNHITIEEGINIGEDFQQSPRLAYYAKKIALVDKVIYYYNCLNNCSYTHSDLSLDAWKQGYRSAQIIIDFCQDKGKEFVQAAENMHFQVATEGLMNLTKSKLYKKEYTEMLAIINSRHDLWKTQPIFYRICFILQNIYFVAIWVRTARSIYRLFMKIRGYVRPNTFDR